MVFFATASECRKTFAEVADTVSLAVGSSAKFLYRAFDVCTCKDEIFDEDALWDLADL